MSFPSAMQANCRKVGACVNFSAFAGEEDGGVEGPHFEGSVVWGVVAVSLANSSGGEFVSPLSCLFLMK